MEYSECKVRYHANICVQVDFLRSKLELSPVSLNHKVMNNTLLYIKMLLCKCLYGIVTPLAVWIMYKLVCSIINTKINNQA